MTTQTKVSICLPTCNRPELIGECLDSCLAQTHGNVEIVIGDDSTDDATHRLIEARYRHDPRIRYVRNEPPLGQGANVDSLFLRAIGDKILLIHDDDYLVESGVENLLSLWETYPDLEVAFGDQYEMDQTGHVDLVASERLNRAFFRTKIAEGLQKIPGCTGLIQMFPNNAWMANAKLVRQIGYKEQYGVACDFVFGAELCLAAKQVYYIKEYVSYYRKTDVSVSQATRGSAREASVFAYAFVSGLKLDPCLEPARRTALRRLVPHVVSIYSKNRAPMRGLRIALQHLFAYNYGCSIRLYHHLMIIAKSMLSLKIG